MHRERREPDGTRVGHVTDEVTQRGIWREWKRLMIGREEQAESQAGRIDTMRLVAVD
jgi:hypothetical protein